jgi:nitroreductase
MEFRALLKTRRAVRKYRQAPVTEANVAAILEAVDLAPTAGNLQSFRVVIVRSQEQRDALAEAALGQTFAATAPMTLVFLADVAHARTRYQARGELFAIQDATIAATHAWLALSDLGLGGCWIGAFDDAKMSAVVGAPEGCLPVAAITIGVPDDGGPQAKKRRGVPDLVTEGKRDGAPYANA